MRLLFLILIGFAVSILGVSAIKVTVVFMAELFYGLQHVWGWSDLKDVVKQGLLLGVVFGVFSVVQYIRLRKRS
ncbi:hypothetical protein CR51_17325 [Caballeronia megalochromosomata]|jgi:hypothetical protein|nr:hypothetical protein CR51_17325 [Caballeronia megalochromosomata]